MAAKSFAQRLALAIVDELQFIEKLESHPSNEPVNKHLSLYVDVHEALDKLLEGRDLPKDTNEENKAIDLAREMLWNEIEQMRKSDNEE